MYFDILNPLCTTDECGGHSDRRRGILTATTVLPYIAWPINNLVFRKWLEYWLLSILSWCSPRCNWRP